jgi:electron-transferring-flavoprotein dehydrogenase
LALKSIPAFPQPRILYDDQGRVKGVATGDMGIGKDGNPTDNYMRGMELHAKQTIFAEGCRGHLTKNLFEKYDLREGKDPQTFAIGIKELWDIDPEKGQSWPCLAFGWLAIGKRHLWRIVPLSSQWQSGCGWLCCRA